MLPNGDQILSRCESFQCVEDPFGDLLLVVLSGDEVAVFRIGEVSAFDDRRRVVDLRGIKHIDAC